MTAMSSALLRAARVPKHVPPERSARVLPFSRVLRLSSRRGSQFVNGATISTNGLFAESAKPLAAGSWVEVYVEAAGHLVFLSRGVVTMSINGGESKRLNCAAGVHITFDLLPARAQALIHELGRRYDRARAAAPPPLPIPVVRPSAPLVPVSAPKEPWHHRFMRLAALRPAAA